MQKAIAKIRLKILANKAGPSPILGQALGQYGINIMEFSKKFNNETSNIKETILVPITITIYNQNAYEIEIKTPTTSEIIKNIIGITKGSNEQKKKKIIQGENGGKITKKELFHIALFKKSNKWMNKIKIESICKTIIGTMKTIGVEMIKNKGKEKKEGER